MEKYSVPQVYGEPARHAGIMMRPGIKGELRLGTLCANLGIA